MVSNAFHIYSYKMDESGEAPLCATRIVQGNLLNWEGMGVAGGPLTTLDQIASGEIL